MLKFKPEFKPVWRAKPIEQRIEHCRSRIEQIEHELAKERRLLSLLFAEEHLANTPAPEPERRVLSQRDIDGQELLEECREIAKRFGLDFTISEQWNANIKELRRLGIHADIMTKAEFWLEQLKKAKK